MRKRFPVSPRKSRRMFRKSSGSHPVNRRTQSARGGGRL